MFRPLLNFIREGLEHIKSMDAAYVEIVSRRISEINSLELVFGLDLKKSE